MFKFLKRVTYIILSFCILITTVACGNSVNMKLSDEAKKIVSTELIEFVADGGLAEFVIVRPDAVDDYAGPLAVEIFRKYKELYGVTPKQVTDEQSGDGVREILIGNCNRKATEKVQKLLETDGSGRDSDYIICSVDEDIVILGNCGKSLSAAGEVFVEKYLPKKHSNGIYYYKNEQKSNVTVCDLSELSKITIVRPIYNVSYLTQTETEKLRDLLYKKTGYDVPIVNDNISKAPEDFSERGGVLEKTSATEYEIIIGNCNREGVKKINVEYNYEIRIEDKKIFLNGGSPYATSMAVSEFIKLLENNNVISSELSVLNGNYNEAVKGYDNKTHYQPKWWDEFNGTEIDTSKWNVAWDVRSNTSVDGKKCYRGSSKLKNNYVKDGKLYIEAVKTDDAYYGGMLKTDTTMEFLYGYLEISDIHPKGNGFWTALWTVSKSGKYNRDMWHSETDIDEAFGGGNEIVGNLWAWPTSYGRKQLNLHNGRSDTVKDHGKYEASDLRGLWQDFHTYGLEWIDNKTLRFTIDGYVWREAELEREELQKAYSQYMVVQISMATAFQAMGLVTQDEWAWENSNKFIVDWIYLYQKQGQGLLHYR